jgi:hypothetical protein
MSVAWCGDCAEYVDSCTHSTAWHDNYAPNGELIKRDCDGFWHDVAGRTGYTVRFSGTWYCYTCGVVCDCHEDEGE